MSAVYPSDEPEEKENPNGIIDRIIDGILGRGDPDDVGDEEEAEA